MTKPKTYQAKLENGESVEITIPYDFKKDGYTQEQSYMDLPLRALTLVGKYLTPLDFVVYCLIQSDNFIKLSDMNGDFDSLARFLASSLQSEIDEVKKSLSHVLRYLAGGEVYLLNKTYGI